MTDGKKLARDAFYIFLLGVTTYAWWKISSFLKRKIME